MGKPLNSYSAVLFTGSLLFSDLTGHTLVKMSIFTGWGSFHMTGIQHNTNKLTHLMDPCWITVRKRWAMISVATFLAGICKCQTNPLSSPDLLLPTLCSHQAAALLSALFPAWSDASDSASCPICHCDAHLLPNLPWSTHRGYRPYHRLTTLKLGT